MPSEQIETEIPSTDAAPSQARAFLRGALQTWKLDGFGQLTELLIDELVSNVVRHVGSGMTVRALRQPERIRIEVEDPNPQAPQLLHPSVETREGRGIMLVDALAAAWGSDVRADGKTVWFEIDVSKADEEIHGD